MFADIVFSTAHKAKGLEFDTVRLADDFNIETLSNSQPTPVCYSTDERNLMYVAVTRAKKRLILNDALLMMMQCAGVSNSDKICMAIQ